MFSTEFMPSPPPPRVLVIGAGIGGLTAAALLAQQGLSVQVLERAAAPGGKMRQVAVDAHALDGGPTVLTMRWVFDELFERLGLGLDDHLQLKRCEVLARHSWASADSSKPWSRTGTSGPMVRSATCSSSDRLR